MGVPAGAGMWPIPCKAILKGKGGLADRSGLLMKPHDLSGCVVVAFALLSLSVTVEAQTYGCG
jgi:hypothetical protein